MSLMMSRTYEALIEAGASPEKAREAAEEVANLNTRLTKIEIMLVIIIGGIGYLITLFHQHLV